VVLLFSNDQWNRLVPTSWQIVPDAWAVFVHYATFHFPAEPNGFYHYNALQQLAYFGVVFVLAPLAMPRSRRNPQFNKSSLAGSLKKAGLGYLHLPGLGGLRHPKRESLNPGWRNASFRGYADYMQTPEFEQRLDEMIQVAKAERIVLMCVEAVPWRCPGPWYPRRGHHEPDSPPYLFAYSVRQSPRHHDRLSGQGFADHSKAAR